MASFVFRIEGLDDLRASLDRIRSGLASFPQSNNPLLKWREEYGAETQTAALKAPTVGQSGTFRGNPWPKLKPAYTRKAPPGEVPVWGGVTRVRAGRVTRATGSTTRTLKSITKAQRKGLKAELERTIQRGDVYTGGKVLGKLRGASGARYKASDIQLSATGKLIQDWAFSAPVVADAGRSVTVISNTPYAQRQHAIRPFAWGPQIEREESDRLLARVGEYVDALFREQSR